MNMPKRCAKPMPESYVCQWHEGHEGECRAEYQHRMNAYYYSFETTGVEAVDRILSAVASAGKGFHHTESWNDSGSVGNYPPFRGDNYVDWIQNAANDAAAAFRRLDEGRQADAVDPQAQHRECGPRAHDLSAGGDAVDG